MRHGGWRLGMVALVGWLALVLAPCALGAIESGSVTMVSESGDYIGGGSTFLFDAPNSFRVSGSSSQVAVTTNADTPSTFGYTFTFQAPSGQQLHAGEYPLAQRFPVEPGGYAGLDVSGNGRGCNQNYGRFIVKDIHVNSSGNVDRFWALYEQHCERYGAPPLFGEVRVGEPASAATEVIEPAAVTWPTTAVGGTSPEVPVTVTASSPSTISRVALGGVDANQFRVTSDGCTGTALGTGDQCQVYVAVHPNTPGDLSAELDLTDASSVTTAVPLGLLVQPHVTSVSPAAGPPAGGNSVTVSGENFAGAQEVDFNGKAAPFTALSPTQLVVQAPAGTQGQSASVLVFGPHGTAGTASGVGYAWANPPSPPNAPSASAGLDSATVQFSSPSDDGGASVTGYTVTASPGGAEATGNYPPLVVHGLNPGTRYTFAVTATNVAGTSSPADTAPVTTLKSTNTTVGASPASTAYGTPVTLSAHVSSGFSGTPTGNVVFSTYRGTIGSASVGQDQTATIAPQVLDVGTTVNATYSGDAAFWTSQGSLQPSVRPANTQLKLEDSPNPSPPDGNVRLTATVSNLDTSVVPSGAVQFTINGDNVGGSQAVGPAGVAMITLQALPAGNYRLGAQYHDTAHSAPDFVDSSATVVHTSGNPAGQTTTASSTGGSPPGASQGGGTPAGGISGGGAGTRSAPPCAARLIVGRPSVSHSGAVTVAVRPSCLGVFAVVAAAGGHTYQSIFVGAPAGARHVFRLPPSPGVRRMLARGAAVKVKITVQFVPLPAGATVERRLTVTLRPRRLR